MRNLDIDAKGRPLAKGQRPTQARSGKGRRKRRRWSAEEKIRIVRESFSSSETVTAVARRSGGSRPSGCRLGAVRSTSAGFEGTHPNSGSSRPPFLPCSCSLALEVAFAARTGLWQTTDAVPMRAPGSGERAVQVLRLHSDLLALVEFRLPGTDRRVKVNAAARTVGRDALRWRCDTGAW